MWLIPEGVKLYLRIEPTDMRKSIDTLSILVADVLELDPASGHLFLFHNRYGDKIKALYYEQNCFTLWYRRLEKGRFIFPKNAAGHIELSQDHLRWLLASDKYSRLDVMVPESYDSYS